MSDISLAVKHHIARSQAENHPKAGKKEGDFLRKPGARLVDLAHTLAANLNRIIGDLKERRDPRGSNQGLASRIGGGFSSNTVGRARTGRNTTLETVALLARALGLRPLQLLAPDLDPKDPPEIVTDPVEKQLLRAWRNKPPQVKQDGSPDEPPNPALTH